MPAISGSVPVTGFVAPTDDADTYPAHHETYGKGGYRSVDTVTDRDAIPSARRKAGMVVKVLANKMEYILGAGLGNGDWEKNPSGSMQLGAYSELAALNGSQLVDGSTFFCRYRESQTYGGSGHFYFSASSTVTADGSMVIAPADNSGRFHRVWDGEPLNILWFGAKPTLLVGGTLTPAGTFDNSVPINAAINWARTPTYGPTDVRASVFIPAGDFWISNPIVNRYRVDVAGLGCVFADNEFTSHAVSSSGQVSGASRIRLADGANCPMMTWSLSDASQRYTFAYTDDGLSTTATVTIASPGVITCTAHGLTVGRRVGFTTTGSLPTGISPSTIYYVQSVPTADTLTISATSGGAAINTSGSQSGVHTLVKDPTPKYVAGNTIRGINFFGNSANQTRYDCHIIKVEYAWNIRLDNCNFGNPSGYMVWALDCNTLDIVDCYGNGGATKNKGVFLFSNADGFMSQSKFGGVSGPALWVCGANGWQQQYLGNFLYNNFKGQFTVSGIASDELTIGTHDFETGMPVELSAASGATLPTLTRYPSVALDSHVFWAIKTASDKIKLAYSYEDALGGTALAITGGSGTYYAWHGAAAGAYLSGGANNNVLSGNRCDQNQNFGIALNKATENVVTGNLLNLNGFDSLTATPELTTSAGVYLRNGSANNVVMGNSMMDWGTNYAQTYGVWVDASNGRNFIGQNAFKANPSQVDSLISTTGNTTETAVVNQVSGVTVSALSAGQYPLKVTNTTAGSAFGLTTSTDLLAIDNTVAALRAAILRSSASEVRLTLGGDTAASTARPLGLYAEASTGTDIAGATWLLVTSRGTGNNTGGGTLDVYVPVAGSSGATVQSTQLMFRVARDGIRVGSVAGDMSVGLTNGCVWFNSTENAIKTRLNNTNHYLSDPNKPGVNNIATDAGGTLTVTPTTSLSTQRLNAAITANRTVTLSSIGAALGTKFRFIRSSAATGAFNWDIGGLKTLTAASTWCDVEWDGSAYILTANGSL